MTPVSHFYFNVQNDKDFYREDGRQSLNICHQVTSPMGAVRANSWAVKACDYVLLERLQWTITDVEFKQWGVNSQMEQAAGDWHYRSEPLLIMW